MMGSLRMASRRETIIRPKAGYEGATELKTWNITEANMG